MPTVTPCKRKAAKAAESPLASQYAEFVESVSDSPLSAEYTSSLENMLKLLYKHPDKILLAEAWVQAQVAPVVVPPSAAALASGGVDTTDWPNIEKAADIDK
eukprot:8064217-Pyramimonas_sp.AAC.1